MIRWCLNVLKAKVLLQLMSLTHLLMKIRFFVDLSTKRKSIIKANGFKR